MAHLSRLPQIALSLMLLTIVGLSAVAGAAAPAAEVATGDRLVVFEAFLRPICGNCQRAAPQIDQLAQEFAGQPVVWLEYDVDADSMREGRWWAAYRASGGSGGVALPMAMVDSGAQFRQWLPDYTADYRQMVEQSRARPPRAHLEAFSVRSGDRLKAMVRVTNQSGVTLSATANSAMVWLIVYEERQVHLTGRFVRAEAMAFINTPLAPGASADFTLETAPLTGLDWSRLHAVALVDYQPAGASSGAYDTLQAAVVAPMALTTRPEAVGALYDPARGGSSSATFTVNVPPTVPWQASVAAPWVQLAPDQGVGATLVQVTFLPEVAGPGLHQDLIKVQVATEGFVQTTSVPARLFVGPIERLFLALVQR